jgi:ABC-type polysaccharide/polyol phosphate transport system ATPase subunit/predicted SAM-dependent methyltransferase
MSDVVIQVDNLSKRFKIYSSPWARALEWATWGKKSYHQDFWALQGISFQVKKGECLGVIGPNGAGKSTLLKVLTRSLYPTTGTFHIRGNVLSLLELGTGFNPELTGRQNIYRSSQLLGFPEGHVAERIRDIQEFAEIAEFFDRPIKTYSSGMYVRLAFSMFAFLRPDVLIVDEALSVGDLRFQKKSKEKMNELKRQGVTMLFVSHIMSDINSMCERALFLQNGQMAFYGGASDAINAYTYSQNLAEVKSVEMKPESPKQTKSVPTEYGGDRGGTGEIFINNVLCYQKGKDKYVPEIYFGENIMIEFDYEAVHRIVRPIFRINFSLTGYDFFANIDSTDTGLTIPFIEGNGKVTLEIKQPNLYPQAYKVNIGVLTENVNSHLFFWNEAGSFLVLPPHGKYMYHPTAIVKLEGEIGLSHSEQIERDEKRKHTKLSISASASLTFDQDKIKKFIPFMNDIEVQAIVSSLQLFHKPIQALEWGSGNSTVFFPAHLPKGSEWTSIEHNAAWVSQIKKIISEPEGDKIHIYHVPCSDKWHEGADDGDYDTFRDYIFFPTTLNKKFQSILVDGRARVECMQIGWMLLENFGIMILHDAQRNQYRRGIPSDCFFLKMVNPRIDIDGNISVIFMSKSRYIINLLLAVLKEELPDYIQFECDDHTSSDSSIRMSWEKLESLPFLKLYAGDLPDFVEYEGLIGLSPVINDYRHIKHDIQHPFPLPDDSVDSFQAEDVFEHIPYDKLRPIINEIFRVLKPGANFRLSLPDYGCDVLQNRSVKDVSGGLVFDPGGGGVPEKPGHVWFPRIDNVKSLLEKTDFHRYGVIEYLHYWHLDGTFVVKKVDYSKGNVRRSPDFDVRVMEPYRPMSMIIDLQKGPAPMRTDRASVDGAVFQTEIESEGRTKDNTSETQGEGKEGPTSSSDSTIFWGRPNASPLKFLQVHTFYPGYFTDFYYTNPHLAAAPFTDQINGLISGGFAALHMFAPYMAQLGYESHLIIANNPHSQHQWLRENNLSLENPDDWLYETSRRQINHLKPEVLYLGDPISFDSRFIRSLSWKPPLILGWRAANIPEGTDWTEFDVILSHLTVCRRAALALGAKAVEHFFPGMPILFAEEVTHQQKKYDVVFSAQWTTEHQNRNRYIEVVARSLAGSKNPVSLAFFIAADKPESLPIAVAKYNRGPRWGVNMYRTLKRGRIVLNAEIDLARGEAGNMRLFETTGVGSFLLTEYHENIREYFEPGIEIETFRDENDLIEKIYYYLAHPVEREAIAKRGQERCLREYSIQKRATAFDEIIHRYHSLKFQSASPVSKSGMSLKEEAMKLLEPQ